jgi:hypothetical protein
LFHGSEVAFWPNPASHFAGVVQAVPDEPETEIILETTANGVGGEYHERWQQAEGALVITLRSSFRGSGKMATRGTRRTSFRTMKKRNTPPLTV